MNLRLSIFTKLKYDFFVLTYLDNRIFGDCHLQLPKSRLFKYNTHNSMIGIFEYPVCVSICHFKHH